MQNCVIREKKRCRKYVQWYDKGGGKQKKREKNRDCCRTNNKNECSLCTSHSLIHLARRPHHIKHHKSASNVWLSHQSFCYVRLFSIINIRICCKFFLCQQTMVVGIFAPGSLFFRFLSFFLLSSTTQSEKVSANKEKEKREAEQMKDFKCKWHVKFEFWDFDFLHLAMHTNKIDWMKPALADIDAQWFRFLTFCFLREGDNNGKLVEPDARKDSFSYMFRSFYHRSFAEFFMPTRFWRATFLHVQQDASREFQAWIYIIEFFNLKLNVPRPIRATQNMDHYINIT